MERAERAWGVSEDAPDAMYFRAQRNALLSIHETQQALDAKITAIHVPSEEAARIMRQAVSRAVLDGVRDLVRRWGLIAVGVAAVALMAAVGVGWVARGYTAGTCVTPAQASGGGVACWVRMPTSK
jgi:hypothetical protein